MLTKKGCVEFLFINEGTLMSNLSVKILTSAILFSLPLVAHSTPIDTSKLTVFVEAGEVNLNANFTNATTAHPNGCEIDSLLCDLDTNRIAYGVGVAYEYNENFSFSMSYHDFGKTYDLYAAASTETMYQKSQMISAAVVAKYPLESGLTPFAEFGVGYYFTDARYSGPFMDLKTSDTGLTPIYGLGLGYSFSDNCGVKMGWRRVVKMGSQTEFLSNTEIRTIDADSDFAYLSLGYSFN